MIDWIESRIRTEHKKHSKNMPDKWFKICAIKIKKEFEERENER